MALLLHVRKLQQLKHQQVRCVCFHVRTEVKADTSLLLMVEVLQLLR